MSNYARFYGARLLSAGMLGFLRRGGKEIGGGGVGGRKRGLGGSDRGGGLLS